VRPLGEFRSDNAAPAHPAVLEALAEANRGPAGAYGDDPWTGHADGWFRDQFGGDAEAFLVWNGTGANVVALRAAVRPWHAVITSQHAHIHVDECGAPELLAGCKVVDLPSADAKLTVDQVEAAGRDGVGFEHHVQPRLVSLTQSTEYGTVYTVEEMAAICEAAHRLGLLVHVDGARLSNAAASLDLPLRAVSRDAGVDLLSFGLTKNGAMAAEAVVCFRAELVPDLRYIRKQTTQLASKMRYLAAQVVALAADDRWLTNARHANAMARRLAGAIAAVPAVTLTQPVEANAVFARLPGAVIAALQEEFRFYLWNAATDEVRLMTSWATDTAEVDAFAARVRTLVAGGPTA
jgi:threonine aldolase